MLRKLIVGLFLLAIIVLTGCGREYTINYQPAGYIPEHRSLVQQARLHLTAVREEHKGLTRCAKEYGINICVQHANSTIRNLISLTEGNLVCRKEAGFYKEAMQKAYRDKKKIKPAEEALTTLEKCINRAVAQGVIR